MLDTSTLTPGKRCLYKRLALSYESTRMTIGGHRYHCFRTGGGTEKRLGDKETARLVWVEIFNITEEE